LRASAVPALIDWFFWELILRRKLTMSLCVAAMFKDALRRIDEWLQYHLSFGVDHFFLLQDICSDIDMLMTVRVLQKYIEDGVVTLYDSRKLFPETYGHSHIFRQRPFYDRITKQLKTSKQFDWLACIDVDEFIVPVRCKTIPELLSLFNPDDIIGVVVHMMVFGCGNTEDIPAFAPASVIETCRSFLLAAHDVRSIGSVQNISYWHIQHPVGEKPLSDVLGNLGSRTELKPRYEDAFCAHYLQQSLETLSASYRNAYFPYKAEAERRQSRCSIAMNRFLNNGWINYPEKNTFDPAVTTNLVRDIYARCRGGF
jgi:hypothetical protein